MSGCRPPQPFTAASQLAVLQVCAHKTHGPALLADPPQDCPVWRFLQHGAYGLKAVSRQVHSDGIAGLVLRVPQDAALKVLFCHLPEVLEPCAGGVAQQDPAPKKQRPFNAAAHQRVTVPCGALDGRLALRYSPRPYRSRWYLDTDDASWEVVDQSLVVSPPPENQDHGPLVGDGLSGHFV